MRFVAFRQHQCANNACGSSKASLLIAIHQNVCSINLSDHFEQKLWGNVVRLDGRLVSEDLEEGASRGQNREASTSGRRTPPTDQAADNLLPASLWTTRCQGQGQHACRQAAASSSKSEQAAAARARLSKPSRRVSSSILF